MFLNQKDIGDVLREETVRMIVGTNAYRKKHLILQLVVNNKADEALKWANKFNLPDAELPWSVRKARYKQKGYLSLENKM
jgi:hypothetical protein